MYILMYYKCRQNVFNLIFKARTFSKDVLECAALLFLDFILYYFIFKSILKPNDI